MSEQAMLNRNAHLDYFHKTEEARKVLEKQLAALKTLTTTAPEKASVNYFLYINEMIEEAYQEYNKITADAREEWCLDVGMVDREPWER